jgi:hypothetical protein
MAEKSRRPLFIGLAGAGVLAAALLLAPDGESKNNYAETLAARVDEAATGAKFNKDGFEMDQVKPVTGDTVRYTWRQVMRRGDENVSEPSPQGNATAACGLLAANGIALEGKTREQWLAARSADRLDEEGADERADGFYGEAAKLCLGTLVSRADAGQMPVLHVPVSES